MAEFTTVKRWSLVDGHQESELVRLVQGEILTAYRKLPGCLGLGLRRIEGTRSYLASQHWESRASRDAAISSESYPEWSNEYGPALREWDTVMTFEEEWECKSVLGERRSATSYGKLTRVLDFRFEPGHSVQSIDETRPGES